MDEVFNLDVRRRAQKTEMDKSLAEQNRLSAEIGALFKQGKKEEAEGLRAKVAALKESGADLKNKYEEAESAIRDLLFQIPNLPHLSVPYGKTPDDNEVYRAWPQPLPELPADALPHWELATKYKIFDLELEIGRASCRERVSVVV